MHIKPTSVRLPAEQTDMQFLHTMRVYMSINSPPFFVHFQRRFSTDPLMRPVLIVVKHVEFQFFLELIHTLEHRVVYQVIPKESQRPVTV